MESTLSTMDDALGLACAGCPSGTVVVAGFQERGRGRVPGRAWTSPPWESLLATVVVKIADIGFPLQQLPLRAGVAVGLAIEESAGIPVQIKWPNDLVFDGKKLAGVLCEAHGDAGLIGLGVNVSQTAFPQDLAGSACSLLQACGRAVPMFPFLASVLARLKAILVDDLWQERLRTRLYALGREVRVDLLGSGQTATGILRDVDAYGRIVLELEGGQTTRIAQGELKTSR